MTVRHRLAPLALFACLVASGCDDPTNPYRSDDEAPQDWPVSQSVIAAAPAVCGAATLTGLMLGPDIRSGSVEVANDESNLYVTFRSETGYPILATAIFVGGSPEEIPTTRRGLPRIFQFPYKSGHAAGSTEIVWEIALGDLEADELVIAAFAQVGLLPSWGEGEPITPDRDWAMYFTHTVADCAAETIGAEGGSARTADGRAALTVPAGALAESVDITVEPATVEDLLERAGSQEVAAVARESSGESAAPAFVSGVEEGDFALIEGELPTVFGVSPVVGSIWELGPDGLEFLVPSTIVLSYDEENLPAGVAEEELGIFVINGIFEGLPSVVDADANTVTAEISHFSYAFVGARGEVVADLEVVSIERNVIPTIGEQVQYEITVRNNGPDASRPTELIFELSGLAEDGGASVLDSVPAVCETRAPSVGDVAWGCLLPALDPEATATVGPFFVTPLVRGGISTLTGRLGPTEHRDTDPANDQLQIEQQVGSPDDIDLRVRADILADSDRTIGGIVGFSGLVTNTGPGVSAGGTLRFEGYGPAQFVFDASGGCALLEDPAPAVAVMECDVPSLAEFDTFSRVMRLEVTGLGVIRVDMYVTPHPDDFDWVPSNNATSISEVIDTANDVDLEPYEFLVVGGFSLGDTLTARARVFNWGPEPSNGGTLTYEVFGDVALVGEIPAPCAEDPESSADLSMVCPVEGGSGAAIPPIEWLLFSTLSNGEYTVRVTVATADGDIDGNPDNDVKEQTFRIGQGAVADLELANLEMTTVGPVAGQPVDIGAEVRNLGPDPSSGGTIDFFIAGDIVFGDVSPSCQATPQAGGGVLSCQIAPLSAGATDANLRLQVIPQVAGDVAVTVRVSPERGGPVDPDLSNNSGQLDIVVGEGG